MKLCQRGAWLELWLMLSLAWWPFIINSCTLCRLQWPKLQLWQPQKGFLVHQQKGCNSARLEEKATTLRMDPGYVHKMFNTIKRAAAAAENGRQRDKARHVWERERGRDAEKDVKNVKYLTTWWTWPTHKANETWPASAASEPGEFQANSKRTRNSLACEFWQIVSDSAPIELHQVRCHIHPSSQPASQPSLKPSIHPARQAVIHRAVLANAHCIATWHNCKLKLEKGAKERDGERWRQRRGLKLQSESEPEKEHENERETEAEPSTIVTINHG